MRGTTVAFVVLVMCLSLLVAGCVDVRTTQKVGNFGTSFGTSSEEQDAINWFIQTYGDPRNDDNLGPRFIVPIMTTGIDSNNLPINNVTTFPVDGGSVYFFVIYDNFKQGDTITVNWTYLENGNTVSSVTQQAGGDFGRFIVEFQKPDSGWGNGRQQIDVHGDGVSATVDFTIGDTLTTTPLPYNSTAGQAAGGVTVPGTTPTDGKDNAGSPGAVTTTTTGSSGKVLLVPAATLGEGSTACTSGLTLCNGKCVSILSDTNNCGQCGNDVSSVPHGYGKCVYGSMVVNKCSSGYVDCNQVASDGCEVNVMTDSKNCLSCGNACSTGEYCDGTKGCQPQR